MEKVIKDITEQLTRQGYINRNPTSMQLPLKISQEAAADPEEIQVLIFNKDNARFLQFIPKGGVPDIPKIPPIPPEKTVDISTLEKEVEDEIVHAIFELEEEQREETEDKAAAIFELAEEQRKEMEAAVENETITLPVFRKLPCDDSTCKKPLRMLYEKGIKIFGCVGCKLNLKPPRPEPPPPPPEKNKIIPLKKRYFELWKEQVKNCNDHRFNHGLVSVAGINSENFLCEKHCFAHSTCKLLKPPHRA